MMADPRCERALQEFQTNPDKALLTYQHDKYIQEFFREFCDVLGIRGDPLKAITRSSVLVLRYSFITFYYNIILQALLSLSTYPN